jgi:hypothetical protein
VENIFNKSEKIYTSLESRAIILMPGIDPSILERALLETNLRK